MSAEIRRLLRQGCRLVTTNLVVAETHALVLRRHGQRDALEFVHRISESPAIVVPSTPDLEGRAVAAWLERYTDHDFSLADAVSFTVMADRGIEEALTLHRHFATAGFRMLPR